MKLTTGPPRWPIVGSLPYISGKHNNLLLGLRHPVEKYGPMLGYYIGTTPIVLVSDFDVLKEICKLDSTSYRCQFHQNFTSNFFLPKCFAQLFTTYNFFGKKKIGKKN